MKIRLVGAELLRADTERHYEAIIAFSNTVNAPEKGRYMEYTNGNI